MKHNKKDGSDGSNGSNGSEIISFTVVLKIFDIKY